MYPQVWGLIGAGIGILGSLSGVFLTSRLTRSWQRTQWIADNKKAEYRELLSSIAKSERLIREIYSVHVQSVEERRTVWEAENETWRVIQDRIFIADSVKRLRVLSRWSSNIGFTAEREGMANFVNEIGALRDDILAAARTELGMEKIE
jgi:hypothetical protein